LALLVLLAAPAQADLKGYLTITINGTQIDGEVTTSPHEGKIEVDALSHLGFATVAAGGTVGQPQHRPITILKPIDRATPLLWKA
jgi:type VI secretion system Hcp family effector